MRQGWEQVPRKAAFLMNDKGLEHMIIFSEMAAAEYLGQPAGAQKIPFSRQIW